MAVYESEGDISKALIQETSLTRNLPQPQPNSWQLGGNHLQNNAGPSGPPSVSDIDLATNPHGCDWKPRRLHNGPKALTDKARRNALLPLQYIREAEATALLPLCRELAKRF